MSAAPRRGPSVGRLLLGVNVFVLLVPVAAVLLFRIYEQHLVHQTERRLIAESALIGEAWRAGVLEAQGRASPGRIQPPHAADARFFPIDPVIDLHAPLASAARPTGRIEPGDAPEWRAGAAIKPLLDRAKLINLSAARVLDARGCVVASTADQLGDCLGELPEVRRALAGRYHAVARARDSDSPRPPVTAISRGGAVRVFTATPLFEDGEVVGVVRMSRTVLDAPKALWRYRRVIFWAFIGSLVLTALVSLFLSRTIVRPVRAITAAAQAIARGEPRPLHAGGRVPAEVFTLSAALDTMTEKLAARAAYIAEFAANVSHELKTPLAGIRGAVELLQDAWAEMDAPQRERFLANIDAGAERMQRLVTRLLHLARIEHGAPEAEEIAVAARLQAIAARHGEAVVVRAEPGATIQMPGEHFDAAVGNLVDNAVKHGGAPVEVTASAEGQRLVVTVRDHGPGISPGNRDRIFDRFFTTARDAGGTGLGLAIVQAIARTRGSEVSFASSPEGTTFTLTL